MASETTTAPTIVGSATPPKVYKHLIGGECQTGLAKVFPHS